MLSKIVRLSIVLLIVAIAVLVVTRNNEPVNVNLIGQAVQISSGLLLITTFIVGFLAASSLACFFAVKGYWRERGYQVRERRYLAFFDELLRVRGLQITGALEAARQAWERLIRQDPTDVIARVELAETCQQSGDLKQALSVLDQARALKPDNIEILMRAAHLNLALNNRTAALDNLSLILKTHATPAVARMARDLALGIQRYHSAEQYSDVLVSLGALNTSDQREAEKISLQLLLAQITSEPADRRKKELKRFTKKYPLCAEGLQALADLEAANGNTDEAAQALAEAAKVSNQVEYWHAAAKLWLQNSTPDKALAAARAAIRDSKGVGRLYAELELIRLLIVVGQLDEANTQINAFHNLATELELKTPNDLAGDLLILQGFCLSRLGKIKEVTAIWKQLANSEYSLPTAGINHSADRKQAPALNLSPL